jgi:predicted cobalt transporter CbtA
LYVARWRKVNYWWGIGFLLIALPHLIGAPQPEVGVSPVPEALARNFAVASVLVAAFFWVLLGGVQGYIFERLGRQL